MSALDEIVRLSDARKRQANGDVVHEAVRR
jgi:hypothetical protein